MTLNLLSCPKKTKLSYMMKMHEIKFVMKYELKKKTRLHVHDDWLIKLVAPEKKK